MNQKEKKKRKFRGSLVGGGGTTDKSVGEGGRRALFLSLSNVVRPPKDFSFGVKFSLFF